MKKEYHAVINGEIINGKEFEKFAENRYGRNWEQILDNMATGERGAVDVEMVNGIESGIYEGPSGF